MVQQAGDAEASKARALELVDEVSTCLALLPESRVAMSRLHLKVVGMSKPPFALSPWDARHDVTFPSRSTAQARTSGRRRALRW